MHAVVLAVMLQAAPTAPQPDLQEILQKMYARVDRDAARMVSGARWMKHRIDEDVSNPLKPKLEHRERYRVWGNGSGMLQLKIWRDGKHVSDPSGPLSLFINRAFLDQFEYALADPVYVPCDESMCWRIAFTPKPGTERQSGDLEQYLLARAAGTLLVDTEDFGIHRADAHTLEPYRSFKVDVYWLSVSLTQVAVGDVMVTATIEMSYSVDPIFGGLKTKRRFYEYTDVTLPPSR